MIEYKTYPKDALAANTRDARNRPIPSAEIIPIAKEICDGKVLLAFSGKDSLAAWLYLRENGFDVRPYTFFVHPLLSFQREALAYYEDFFGVNIYCAFHPNYTECLRLNEYQSPFCAALFQRWFFPKRTVYQMEKRIASLVGLPENYLCALGYRASDGIGRRSFITAYGALNVKKRRNWFTIWDWRNKQVFDIIQRYNVKVSREYALLGSTSDDYNALTLRRLYLKSPDDYAILKKYQPLIGAKIVRYYFLTPDQDDGDEED